MAEGFQLDVGEIVEKIHEDIQKGGWSLSSFVDSYKRPHHNGMSYVYDPVDRAVVVFVGPKKQAQVVYEAAREALGGDRGPQEET